MALILAGVPLRPRHLLHPSQTFKRWIHGLTNGTCHSFQELLHGRPSQALELIVELQKVFGRAARSLVSAVLSLALRVKAAPISS